MQAMNSIGYAAIFLYVPLVLALFQFLRPHRACIAAYLIGWLFLPTGSVQIHGVIDLSKVTLPSLAVLLATFLFDFDRLAKFRFRVWDIPMLLWTICPLFSSVLNHLGPRDGIATITNVWIGVWGLPYFLARIYFDDLWTLRDLAAGIVLGALLYMPLCLWEIRMSPQLHFKLYGFVQHDFIQTKRENNEFRPMVFMQHGLALATFMAMSTVIAAGLWLARARLRILGLSMFTTMVLLGITTVWCHSLGATIWMFVGVGAVLLVRAARSPWPLVAILLIPPAYMVTRATGIFTGQSLVTFIEHYDMERGDSLRTRLFNEDRFVARALKQPIEGFASTEWFPRDPDSGNYIGIPDGLWVIVLGKHGLIGLVSITLALLIPVWLLIRSGRGFWLWDRISQFNKPSQAQCGVMVFGASLAIVSGLFMFDCLMNAMPNPLFVLAGGGIVSVWAAGRYRVAVDDDQADSRPVRQPLWRPDGTSSLQPAAEFPEPAPFPTRATSRPTFAPR